MFKIIIDILHKRLYNMRVNGLFNKTAVCYFVNGAENL